MTMETKTIRQILDDAIADYVAEKLKKYENVLEVIDAEPIDVDYQGYVKAFGMFIDVHLDKIGVLDKEVEVEKE